MDDQGTLHIIPDLDQLIDERLPCDQSRIISTNYSRMSTLEACYGYKVLMIDFELVNTTTGEQWELYAVAKIVPNKSEIEKSYEIQTTFKKELGLYMTARDSLNKFLKSKGQLNGIEIMPTPFGGRFNIDGSDTMDEHAVLIVSNLKKYGFRRFDKKRGFDLECSNTVLKALAEFHGSALGLKINHPEEFEQNIKNHLTDSHSSRSRHKITRDQMTEVLKEESFSCEVIQKATEIFDRRSIKNSREPWATIIHNNTKVDNILIRFDKYDRPSAVKLIDFRLSEYQSPARDLLHFLFTSVQLDVLESHLDDLIDFYYHTLFNQLQKLDVDTWFFARWSFNEELKVAASQSEFFKTVSTLNATFSSNLDVSKGRVIDPMHRKRLCFLVKEFNRRDWLCL
ncbi:uncharacterized protein LOC143205173 [Rhynchophorus ferrugineus]|uniref:CHK kinase-like domain-containing protein n=1 Tax=Rhynchophorus ferrugineus TaxID=354439 RepID=A0A834M4P9_RHYFE|nr:hypothetical protein GWI33_015244 [Rhynchophorus ferrugineus]